jgi:hypothetical protein
MSENPYESPLADVRMVGAKSCRREDMRSIAIYQKGIVFCLLVQFLAVIGLIVAATMRFSVTPEAIGASRVTAQILVLVLLATSLVAIVFAFLLSLKVYRTAMGILLAILTLVPLLGLFVLLIANGKATAILRQNGHKVGLLGASLAEFTYSLQVDPPSPHPDPLPEGEGALQEPS